MVTRSMLNFNLNKSLNFNLASSLVHHSIQYQPLETTTLNNIRMPMKYWVREGPPPIPQSTMINCFLPSDFKMNIFLWNCKGAGNLNFRRTLRDLMSQYSLDMFILTKTKFSKDRTKSICTKLPFDHYTIANTIGQSRGI